MFRIYTIAVGVLMGAAVVCSTACSTATDADLPVTLVSVDEDGPASPAELFEESDVIVIARLMSIDEHAGFALGPDEDEPGAEFVELVNLNFKIEETLKGSSSADLTLKWWGFDVANVDGTPGERTALVELQGIRFLDFDIGHRFMLFLEDYDGKYGYGFNGVSESGVTTVTLDSGISRVSEDGAITSTGHGGLLSSANLYVGDVREAVSQLQQQ